MLKFTRLQEPEVLATNWEKYGERYKQNRIADTGFSFTWPTIERVTLNNILLPTLLLQTQDSLQSPSITICKQRTIEIEKDNKQTHTIYTKNIQKISTTINL